MRRPVLVVAAVLVVVPLLLMAAAGPLLNTAAVRQRILDAMGRATGHVVVSNGPIGIAWSLEPSLSLSGLLVLNPPGFSRPELASLRRVEARVALLPLLSGTFDVPELWVEGADVLLERDAAGRGNWLPPVPAAEPAPAPPAASRPHRPVTVHRVHLSDAHMVWQGAPPVQVRLLEASPAGGPLSGSIGVNAVPITLAGSTQPMTPDGMPFEVTAVGGGLALAASGRAGGPAPQPVAFQAKAADLAALSPLIGRPVPSVRDVTLSGQFGPAGWAGLTLTAGATDLGTLFPGLSLTRMEVRTAAPGQPVQASGQGAIRNLPVDVTAALGAAAPDGAMPLQARLAGDGATLSIAASLAGWDGRWTDATVAARVPDLARSGALAGVALPPWHDVSLDARAQPAPAGAGLVLRGLRLLAGQSDAAGDLSVTWAPRPSLRGSLISQRLDLDGWAPLPPPAVPPGPPSAPAPASPPPAAPAAPPAAPPAAQLLPFPLLQRADADLRWSVATLTFGGAAYQSGVAHLVLQGGRLRADPVSIAGPGGPIQAALLADATATPPTAALVLRAAALDSAAVAAAFGAPGAVTGPLDIDVDLKGAGATQPAMIAGLDGHAAVALTDGDVENAALAALFGQALRGAGIPVDPAGRSRLRCLASRIDVAAGQATIKALGLDTSKLRLAGDGTLDLPAQTMDLHLRPTVRLGPTSVEVPVRLTGPWRAPRAAADRGVIAPGRFGISIGAPAADVCAPALAAIHGAPAQ